MSASEDRPSTWTFLTHHARVLVEIARDPAVRLRDIADKIGITERAVQNIVSDLYEAGYLARERIGRRNRYSLNLDQHFRYPTEADLPIGLLIGILIGRDLPGTPGGLEPTPAGEQGTRSDVRNGPGET
ncbi:helix-turn-helix transcriptional regulator [Nonomuraea jiangxiensis]|uniref:MarR family protein n=1 Tax=Nonomuraea jiangxiensis TaxID=633440 RepID=A0A1G8S931_9ACTN|nr:MarR family transcriptional regulator [Nonomuraea jiangxiensis]SDJ25709.1 MarR family protein [Nonomuraea jiangxiensis]